MLRIQDEIPTLLLTELCDGIIIRKLKKDLMADSVKRLKGLDKRCWVCAARTTIAVLNVRNWPLRLMKIQAAYTSTN